MVKLSYLINALIKRPLIIRLNCDLCNDNSKFHGLGEVTFKGSFSSGIKGKNRIIKEGWKYKEYPTIQLLYKKVKTLFWKYERVSMRDSQQGRNSSSRFTYLLQFAGIISFMMIGIIWLGIVFMGLLS